MPRSYAGRTGTERTADRRDRLVGAAFGMVAEGGWLQLSIEALCREAGLNKRYFYESFTGLDEVIAAVTTTLADEAIATTLAAVPPDADDAEVVRSAIAAFVAHLTDDPRRARVLFGAVPAGDAAASHRAAAIRQVIATVATQGHARRDLGEDPAVELTAAMLVGGTSQAVLEWLDGRLPYAREDFIEDLTRMWQLIADGASEHVREREALSPPSRRSARR